MIDERYKRKKLKNTLSEEESEKQGIQNSKHGTKQELLEFSK